MGTEAEKIRLVDKEELVEKEKEILNLNVKGVFIEIGFIPNSEFINIVEKNSLGVIDCHNYTNIEGIFSAGDVTNVFEKQIIVTCGEGGKASLSAFRYLSTHKF